MQPAAICFIGETFPPSCHRHRFLPARPPAHGPAPLPLIGITAPAFRTAQIRESSSPGPPPVSANASRLAMIVGPHLLNGPIIRSFPFQLSAKHVTQRYSGMNRLVVGFLSSGRARSKASPSTPLLT